MSGVTLPVPEVRFRKRSQLLRAVYEKHVALYSSAEWAEAVER